MDGKVRYASASCLQNHLRAGRINSLGRLGTDCPLSITAGFGLLLTV